MPEIQLLQEEPKMEFRAPVQAESISSGAIMGNAIQKAGEGIDHAGMQLDEIQGRKKELQRSLDTKEGTTNAEGLWEQAKKQAFMDPSTKEDKSNWGDNAQKIFSRLSQGLTDKYGNPQTVQGINNNIKEIQNKGLSQIDTETSTYQHVYIAQKVDDLTQKSIQSVRDNPANYKQAQQDIANVQYNVSASGWKHGDDAKAAFEKAQDHLYEGTVDGYLNRGSQQDIDAAILFVRQEASQTKDANLYDRLNNKIITTQREFHSTEAHKALMQDRALEKHEKIDKQVNEGNLLAGLLSANDQASREQAINAITSAAHKSVGEPGVIDVSQIDKILNTEKLVKRSVDNEVFSKHAYVQIENKLYGSGDKDLDNLFNQTVKTMLSGGGGNPVEGSAILKKIAYMRDHEVKDPYAKDREVIAKGLLIQKMAGVDGLSDGADPEQRAQAVKMMTAAHEYRIKNGVPIDEAMRWALSPKGGGGFQPDLQSIPGADPGILNDSVKLKKWAAEKIQSQSKAVEEYARSSWWNRHTTPTINPMSQQDIDKLMNQVNTRINQNNERKKHENVGQ